MKTKCPFKHTAHQFNYRDFYCEKCEGRNNSRCEEIEFVTPEDSDCTKIHSEAKFMCLNCQTVWTGEQLAKIHEAQERCAKIMKEAGS